MHVGTVQPDRHVAGHLVRAADQRQPVAAVQIAVVFDVVERRMAQHLDRVGAPGRDQRGRLAVGKRQVRDNDRAALRVALVGPIAHGHFERAAQLGLVGAVAAPGHDCFLQTEQRQMAKHVLAIFLRGVNDVRTARGDARLARELLAIGE